MENASTQKVSIRLPLNDYGWIMRYASSHDMTVSQVVRKAITMMRIAVTKKEQKQQETVKE